MSTMFVRNAAGTGWINAASAAGFKIRNAAGTGWIDRTGSLTGVLARNAAATGWLSFGGGSPTYSVSPSAGSVAEGGTVTFTVSAPSMGSGTLYWTNAGSTVGADFSDGQNSGSVAISGGAGSISRTLVSDGVTEGAETIVLQLRTGSTGGTIVATASAVNVTDTGTPVPTQLSLAQNDLDFYTLPSVSSSVNTAYNDVICTVDTSGFYSNGAWHIAFPVDLVGVQGSNNPHCGPIYRNGKNMWSLGRGFIIYGDGTVMAEQWNGTFSPGLSTALPNSTGGSFSPGSTPVFTVRMRSGYRDGGLANQMTISIHAGSSIYGALVFAASVPWGWDWTGVHTAAIAGIGYGFKKPADSGCVEELLPRAAAAAVLPFSGFEHRIF